MSSPPSNPINNLDYAPPLPLHKRRLGRRIIIFAAFLVAGVLLAKLAPPYWRNAQLYYWQQKCLAYTAPADSVVVRIANSVQTKAVVPVEWNQLYSLISPPGPYSLGTVFLGERRTADGTRYLVVVDWLGMQRNFGSGSRDMFMGLFYCGTIKLGTLSHSPQMSLVNFTNVYQIPMNANSNTDLTLYAGQAVSDEPTHFTIRYQAGNGDEMLDGWLQANGKLVLELRRPTPPTPPSPATLPTGG